MSDSVNGGRAMIYAALITAVSVIIVALIGAPYLFDDDSQPQPTSIVTITATATAEPPDEIQSATPDQEESAPLRLTITPDEGRRGAPVTLIGTGFEPGEGVRVVWGGYGSTGVPMKDVIADDAGNFEAKAVIPEVDQVNWDYEEKGTFKVTATGVESGYETDAIYRVP